MPFTGRGRADDHSIHSNRPAAAVQCSGGLSSTPRGLHQAVKRALVAPTTQAIEQLVQRVLIDRDPVRPNLMLPMRVTQQHVDRIIDGKFNFFRRKDWQRPFAGDPAYVLAMKPEKRVELPIGEEWPVRGRVENLADHTALRF